MSTDFLASMTFANGNNDLGCDCDECGVPLPAPIMEAVHKRKRELLESRPLFSTQERSLISRQDGISIWKTVVPVGADPLIEFGQSHRILWVKHLHSKTRHIKCIGEGIIGSSSEEESRKQMDWEQGDIYLVKSNGGKAVGWTHCSNKANDKSAVGSESKTKDESDSSSSEEAAILVTIKVPINKMTHATTAEDKLPSLEDVTSDSWASYFLKLSQAVLQDGAENSPAIIKLSEEQRKNVRHVMAKVQPKAPTFPLLNVKAPSTPIPVNTVSVATDRL